MSQANKLVRKLWQYCNVLRDDGLSYPDYVEQLTYLLFLKMADEQGRGIVPKQFGWSSLLDKDSDALNRQYAKVLKHLSRQDGLLGLIFAEARSKIRDPAKLKVLVTDLIGQNDWTGMSEDVKGDAYEGLLEKNAQDTKSGAGQYFTPRPIVDAIVTCVQPRPGEVICDPACGTAGFLLAAHDYIRRQNQRMTPAQRRHLQFSAIRGVELVREVARLAAMNLLLHGVGDASGDSPLPIACEDSLAKTSAKKVDVVLTNPPFGVKGSFVSTDAGSGHDTNLIRKDFWVKTANKQLNFLQHVVSLLKPGGRAAVIVPDNVLFEGGAAEEIRRRLLTTCDMHTILRLPAGIFYAQGIKANVLFFDLPKRAAPRPAERNVWIYDLRSGNKFSVKSRSINDDHLAHFVSSFRPGQRDQRELDLSSEGVPARWRPFRVSWLLQQPSCSLDLSWDTEPSTPALPAADRLRMLGARVAEDLREALRHIERASDGLLDT